MDPVADPCHRNHGMTQSTCPLPNIAIGFKIWNGPQRKTSWAGATASRSSASQRSRGGELRESERFVWIWIWSRMAPRAEPQKALGRGEAQTNMLL